MSLGKATFGDLPCFKALCDVVSQASLYIMASLSPQKMAAGCLRAKMDGASDCKVSGQSLAGPRSLSCLQALTGEQDKTRDAEELHTTLVS